MTRAITKNTSHLMGKDSECMMMRGLPHETLRHVRKSVVWQQHRRDFDVILKIFLPGASGLNRVSCGLGIISIVYCNDRQFLSVDLAKSMYIYIHGHVYVYVCVCVCVCVFSIRTIRSRLLNECAKVWVACHL